MAQELNPEEVHRGETVPVRQADPRPLRSSAFDANSVLRARHDLVCCVRECCCEIKKHNDGRSSKKITKKIQITELVL